MLVSIVVPLHNEEENIVEMYHALKSVLDAESNDYELLFVDDGSTDRTLELLEPFEQKDPKVKLLRFRRNFGKAAAWAAGFDHARGEVIVTIDGDLQNDPKDIPKLVSYIGEYDVVNGWRKKRKDPFVIRRFPSIIANKLISKVTGVNLRDYGSGLKAYKAEVVKNMNMYGEMHRFIPAVASWYGTKIKEVETLHHPRRHGRSKYGISRTFMVILDLITVTFLQNFSTKPMQAFGPFGLVCGLSGFIINLYLAFLWFTGHAIGHRPLLMLGVLLVIIGMQLIGMGLLGEMLVNSYHESQRKPLYVLRTPGNSNKQTL
ncbi:MAG: glycosyltransferase family 2 protein [Nitrospirota bacterium]|nr:glycosyltransferase family 2 protein [Nitrospirota bacterium]